MLCCLTAFMSMNVCCSVILNIFDNNYFRGSSRNNMRYFNNTVRQQQQFSFHAVSNSTKSTSLKNKCKMVCANKRGQNNNNNNHNNNNKSHNIMIMKKCQTVCDKSVVLNGDKFHCKFKMMSNPVQSDALFLI